MSLAIFAASPNHGHGAIADDVVTMPSVKARLMPSFTAWHIPKSSPLTTRLIWPDPLTFAPILGCSCCAFPAIHS